MELLLPETQTEQLLRQPAYLFLLPMMLMFKMIVVVLIPDHLLLQQFVIHKQRLMKVLKGVFSLLAGIKIQKTILIGQFTQVQPLQAIQGLMQLMKELTTFISNLLRHQMVIKLQYILPLLI